METVVYGNSISFRHRFYDSNEEVYDPDGVVFSIVRDASVIVYGPYYDEVTFLDLGGAILTDPYGNPILMNANDQPVATLIDHEPDGSWDITIFIDEFIVPGIYAARWEAEVEGELQVYYERFQVIDPPVVANRIVDPTRLYGVMRESPAYQSMGRGTTDRLLLIGHAEGLSINEPYQVVNMQETINMLGANPDCPLTRALLQAYNTGARDIWLMAAAPLTEFMPFDPTNPEARKTPRAEWDNLNFYQRYSQRLLTTYDYLRLVDFPEIVVPVEAPFYDSGDVDFLTPLVFNCYERYRETGSASIGIIGTRIPAGATGVVEAMERDPRISKEELGEYVFSTKRMYDLINYHYGINLFTDDSRTEILPDSDIGKFGMIVAGEGFFQLPQMDLPFTDSIAVVVAAMMACLDIKQGIVNKTIPKVPSAVGYKFSQDEVKRLARKRINTIAQTPLGRRGTIYQSVLATDNTLANGMMAEEQEDYSAFWSAVVMRAIIKITQDIRAMGNRRMGTIGYVQFKKEVSDYMNSLVLTDAIRGFDLNIYRGNNSTNTVYVDLIVQPYFSVREIYFTVEVGPGTGE